MSWSVENKEWACWMRASPCPSAGWGDTKPGSQRGTDQKMLTGYHFGKASIPLWLAVRAQRSRPPVDRAAPHIMLGLLPAGCGWKKRRLVHFTV